MRDGLKESTRIPFTPISSTRISSKVCLLVPLQIFSCCISYKHSFVLGKRLGKRRFLIVLTVDWGVQAITEMKVRIEELVDKSTDDRPLLKAVDLFAKLRQRCDDGKLDEPEQFNKVWTRLNHMSTAAAHCNMQCSTRHCRTLQHTATCSAHDDTAEHCTTRHCRTLQHTAEHCNTLQNTATHSSRDNTHMTSSLIGIPQVWDEFDVKYRNNSAIAFWVKVLAKGDQLERLRIDDEDPQTHSQPAVAPTAADTAGDDLGVDDDEFD